jgi:hypothetical protein
MALLAGGLVSAGLVTRVVGLSTYATFLLLAVVLVPLAAAGVLAMSPKATRTAKPKIPPKPHYDRKLSPSAKPWNPPHGGASTPVTHNRPD